MSMELILKSADVNIPQTIENIEALKTELAPKLEHYEKLVVTPDSIKAAKTDKANLNKLKKAIDEQRIAVKKQCMAVYEPLEAQCKELTVLIDAPIKAIDDQIKAFESGELDRKREELRQAFATLEAPDYVTIEDVINPKWANKTMSIAALTAEMQERVKQIKADEKVLEEQYKDDTEILYPARQKFRECKNLSQTLVVTAKIEYQRKMALWERQKELERQKQAEHTESVQNAPQLPTQTSNEVIPPTFTETHTAQSEQPEKIVSGRFEVRCTTSKLKALVAYMKQNGIEYHAISNK